VTPTPPSAGPPIAPSAEKHGISDQRIWEAYRNPVAEFVLSNGVTIRLGYDSQANLLEIGWIDRGLGRRIIHAMVCRAAWRQEYGLP
jgi:YD repeat-containing protein